MTDIQMLVKMAMALQWMHLGYEKTSTGPVESISVKKFFLVFYGLSRKATIVAQALLNQQKQQICCFFCKALVLVCNGL